MVYEVRSHGSRFSVPSLHEACVKAMLAEGSVWNGPREVARWSRVRQDLEVGFAAMPSEMSRIAEWFEVAA